MSQDKWRLSLEPKDVEFTYKGERVVVTIRPITWSKKNQIISQATAYSQTGEGKFNLDSYNKECLKYMIVKAPWGETNSIFLNQIGDELGNHLEKLIPGPSIGGEEESFLGQESGDSSMEEGAP